MVPLHTNTHIAPFQVTACGPEMVLPKPVQLKPSYEYKIVFVPPFTNKRNMEPFQANIVGFVLTPVLVILIQVIPL